MLILNTCPWKEALLKVALTASMMIMLNELHCDLSKSDLDSSHNLFEGSCYTKIQILMFMGVQLSGHSLMTFRFQMKEIT